MRILFDQQIFSFQEYGGISRYYYELIKGLNKEGCSVLIDGKYSNNLYLPQLKEGVSKVFPNLNFPYKNILLFYLNKIFDSYNLRRNNFDVFHATYYQPYFLSKLKGKPYVVTVYDMTHELFAKDCKGLVKRTLDYKKKTICGANRIIAISQNTKNDLIRLYDIPANKIEVVYLGNPIENVVPSRIKGLPERYLLFVGNREGYKNFKYFIKSISQILIQNTNLELVCAGGGIFTKKENEMLIDLGIEGKVHQVKFKSDSELAFIYKNALVYVLPSLYEGFGLTALEAFSMGCPVVASNTSSIPEVCGNAALYIDPTKEISIAETIKEIIHSKTLRDKFAALGIKQSKRFSWTKTITETKNIYKKLILSK